MDKRSETEWTTEELKAELRHLYDLKNFHKVEMRAEMILDILRERNVEINQMCKNIEGM